MALPVDEAVLQKAWDIDWAGLVLPARTCRFHLLDGGCKFPPAQCRFRHVCRSEFAIQLLKDYTLPECTSVAHGIEIECYISVMAVASQGHRVWLTADSSHPDFSVISYLRDTDANHAYFLFMAALYHVRYRGLKIFPLEPQSEAVPKTAAPEQEESYRRDRSPSVSLDMKQIELHAENLMARRSAENHDGHATENPIHLVAESLVMLLQSLPCSCKELCVIMAESLDSSLLFLLRNLKQRLADVDCK
jgi:hypothetical protein